MNQTESNDRKPTEKAFRERSSALLDFINASPTAFHAASVLAGRLEAAGFSKLAETEPWRLEPGRGYFVIRDDGALFAVRVGLEPPETAGFALVGAHSDSPALKLKPASESTKGNLVRVAVEVYGGPVLSTWLDRELSIAGRVSFRRNGGLASTLVDLKSPVAVIPSLAIHLNRDVNKGVELNPQTMLQALIAARVPSGSKDEIGVRGRDREEAGPGGRDAVSSGALAGSSVLSALVAEACGADPADLLDADLFLYDPRPGAFVGADGELLVSGRIDNLAGCDAALAALIDSPAVGATQVAVFFDAEEIGSRTPQGADGFFLRGLLDRVVSSYRRAGNSLCPSDAIHRAFAASVCVSVDGAHAFNPSYADRYDESSSPVLNGGPVVKRNASFRYASTARTSAAFRLICERSNVPCQTLQFRSDMVSGTTIGPISSAFTGIETVDVGNPMLAMHSIRETAGMFDQFWMVEALREFFSHSCNKDITF
jgi:aspartyl aminopeptidase